MKTKLVKYTLAEEQDFIRKIREGDEVIRRQFILQYQAFIQFFVAKYYNSHTIYSMQDYVQEAQIGLHNAIKNYDLNINIPFTSYLRWWVLDAITKLFKDTGAVKGSKKTNKKIWTDPIYNMDFIDDDTTEYDIEIDNKVQDILNLIKDEDDRVIIEYYFGFKYFKQKWNARAGKYELNEWNQNIHKNKIAEIVGVTEAVISKRIKNIIEKIQQVYHIDKKIILEVKKVPTDETKFHLDIIKLVSAGYSYSETASILRCHRHSVTNLMKKYPELREKVKQNNSKIAKQRAKNKAEIVSNNLAIKRKEINDAKQLFEDKIITLYIDKWSYKEIMKILNLSWNQVCGVIKKYNKQKHKTGEGT